MEPRFGMGLLPSDFRSDRIVPRSGIHHLPTGYRRPWAIARQAAHDISEDMKNLHFGKDGFQACVDVHHFEPSEITVKTVDHTVIIEGKHEERDDPHGSVQRHFIRKYELPKDYDMKTLSSSLSSDGVITLTAHQEATDTGAERIIPISHTNIPALLHVKKNQKEKKEVDSKIENGSK